MKKWDKSPSLLKYTVVQSSQGLVVRMRKGYLPSFKAKVTLEAIKEQKTVYIIDWKREQQAA